MDSMLDGDRRKRSALSSSRRALVQAARSRLSGACHDFPAICRWGMHLTIAALALAAVFGGRLAGAPTRAGEALAPLPPALPPAPARQASARGSGYLVRVAQPRTTLASVPVGVRALPDPASTTSRAVLTYTVQPGDTVSALARRFEITPDTILSANGTLANNPDLLKLGQELVILPVSGVLHEVKEGETLSTIARDYGVDVATITAYADNHLSEPYTLAAGQKVMVPGASLPEGAFVRRAPAGTSSGPSAYPATGIFIWPTAGHISQYPWRGHLAIDIGTPTGTPIYAADAGYVATAGWTNVGYGLHVVLDHGNGYRTLYGHMSRILVEAGQSVQKGALIGRVGSTGNSTGAHLHFEIYQGSVLQNPLDYLP